MTDNYIKSAVKLPSNDGGRGMAATARIINLEAKIERRARRRDLEVRRAQIIRISNLRVVEIERVLFFNYATEMLPGDDAGLDDLRIVFDHLAQTEKGQMKMLPWARRWAPWLSRTDAEAMKLEAIARPRRWNALELAKALNVGICKRTYLGLKTISAVDVSKQAMREMARQIRVKRQRLKRRAEGKMNRAEYETKSASKLKPWLAEGISRATWYRLKRETSV